MKALVVLPTYNEAENIGPISEAILEILPQIHLLIVDDNSPDGTGQIADQLALEQPDRLHVMHRKEKSGLGPAYLAGFRWALEAGYEQVVQMDADFSHPVDLIPQMLQALQESDFVVGSRYIKGGGIKNWGRIRRLISRGGNYYARFLLRLGIKDLTGGYKAFNNRVLEYLLACPIHSKGYHFQIEMTARAVTHGFRCREIPFTFEERTAGQSKMDGGIFFEAMIQTIRLKWKLGRRKVHAPSQHEEGLGALS